MCHHPKRFSEDCVDFNMHEEKEIKEPEKPVPNDLEEAAEAFAFKTLDEVILYGCTLSGRRACFIAGAKWQAEQLLKSSPLPEDTVLFNKGVEEGKRLMMEEAVECMVTTNLANRPVIYLDQLKGFQYGDKVKIIIVKEDEKTTQKQPGFNRKTTQYKE